MKPTELFRKKILVVFLLFCAACQSTEPKTGGADRKADTIGCITITLPSSYTIVPSKGVDTYAGVILDEKKDTFFRFEYGRPGYVNQLFDEPPAPVFALSTRESVIKNAGGHIPGPDEVRFSKSPKIDMDEAIFEKNYYMYDTINGLAVKIVQPKRIGDGITGMYIPELKDSNCLAIQARNLDSARHSEALRILRTIRYK